jgi:hypothetical protein
VLKNSEQQIPRGLKPARNDKNKGFLAAYLNVRPFESAHLWVFQQTVSPNQGSALSGPGNDLDLFKQAACS